MTILTGIKDAAYLVQFLGKKIAIRDEHDKNKYYVYPVLYAIFTKGIVHVQDKDGYIHRFPWERCESPYVILMDKEIILK